jgi:hypothetical protein
MKQERGLLFSLMKDGKVVGYERHIWAGDTTSIAHTKGIDDTILFSHRINHSSAVKYIKHDRKDQFTGIMVGDERLFERDRVGYDRNGTYTNTVAWNDEICGFMFGNDEIGSNITNIKIIGIEGVTK